MPSDVFFYSLIIVSNGIFLGNCSVFVTKFVREPRSTRVPLPAQIKTKNTDMGDFRVSFFGKYIRISE